MMNIPGPPARRMFRRLTLLIILANAWGCGGTTTALGPETESSYQKLLDWTLENGVPGSVLLVRSPRSNYLGAIGSADLARDRPTTADCAFRIGSITKMYVGIVAAQMVAEGKLDLQAKLTELLPAKIADHLTNAKDITLQHLLRHMSGLYDYEGNLGWVMQRIVFNPRGRYAATEALTYAYDKPAMFAPGQRWAYSNTNYLLIGLIIDRACGHSHAVEVRRRILEPLGLTHTYDEGQEPAGPAARTDGKESRAHGYERLPWRVDTTDWSPPIPGPGGMVSTAEEVGVFVRAVARRDNGFLSQATRKVLRDLPWDQKEPAPASWPVKGYYCGISSATFKDYQRSKVVVFFGHDGAYPGYFSFAYHEPERDITIVYLGASTLLGRDHRWGPDNPFFDRLKDALIKLALKENGYPDLTAASSQPADTTEAR
jgi:D-alanyl-D-alanine carboxypeptidase